MELRLLNAAPNVFELRLIKRSSTAGINETSPNYFSTLIKFQRVNLPISAPQSQLSLSQLNLPIQSRRRALNPLPTIVA